MKLYAIIGKMALARGNSWYAYGITEDLELAKKLISEPEYMYSGGEYKLCELREILPPEKAP